MVILILVGLPIGLPLLCERLCKLMLAHQQPIPYPAWLHPSQATMCPVLSVNVCTFE